MGGGVGYIISTWHFECAHGPVGESSTRGIPAESGQGRGGGGGVGTLLSGIPGQTAGNPYLQLSLAAFFPFHPPSHRGLSSGLRVLLRTPAHPHHQLDIHSPFFPFPPALPEKLMPLWLPPSLQLPWCGLLQDPVCPLSDTDGCISQVSWCVCRGTFVTDV